MTTNTPTPCTCAPAGEAPDSQWLHALDCPAAGELDRLEHRIRDAVDGALRVCEHTEIRECPAAAEKLPQLVELAERLERELDELCGLGSLEARP